MRKKKKKWIVTFGSTAAAMAMERRAKCLGVPGRLIPTPTVITADCGLAWMAPIEDREAVERMIKEEKMEYSDTRELLF